MDKTVAQQFAPESENVKPIADSMEVLGALGKTLAIVPLTTEKT